MNSTFLLSMSSKLSDQGTSPRNVLLWDILHKLAKLRSQKKKKNISEPNTTRGAKLHSEGLHVHNIQLDIWPDRDRSPARNLQPDIQLYIWPDIWPETWPDIWSDILLNSWLDIRLYIQLQDANKRFLHYTCFLLSASMPPVPNKS